MRDLQVSEDLDFQRREWRMERAGWVGLAVFVAAAAAGAFGGGPLSEVHAADPGGRLAVRYERFLRASAPSELTIAIRPSLDGEVALRIDRRYWRDVEVSSVIPAPARVAQQGGDVVYVFSGDPAGLEIVFRYEPQRAGRLSGRIATGDGVAVDLRQFAYF